MNYYLGTEFHEYHKQQRVCGIKVGKAIPTIDLISIGIVSEDVKYIGGIDPINKDSKSVISDYDVSREYYAISKDFDIKAAWNSWQLDGDRSKTLKGQRIYWLRENVLRPIFDELSHNETNGLFINKNVTFSYRNFKRLINKYGKTNKQIAEEIKQFCKSTVIFDSTIDRKFYCIESMYNDAVKRKALGQEVKLTKCEPPIIDNIVFYAYYADYDWVVFCQLFGKMIDLPKGFPKYCIDLKQEVDKIVTIKRNNTIINHPDINVAPWNYYLMGIKRDPNYPKQDDEHNALSDAKWNKKLHIFIKNL